MSENTFQWRIKYVVETGIEAGRKMLNDSQNTWHNVQRPKDKLHIWNRSRRRDGSQLLHGSKTMLLASTDKTNRKYHPLMNPVILRQPSHCARWRWNKYSEDQSTCQADSPRFKMGYSQCMKMGVTCCPEGQPGNCWGRGPSSSGWRVDQCFAITHPHPQPIWWTPNIQARGGCHWGQGGLETNKKILNTL